MSTTSDTSPPPLLPDEEWEKLLYLIRSRSVIPIVGPGLVTVPDAAGQAVPLSRFLAPELAKQLRLPEPQGFSSLNAVLQKHIYSGGKRTDAMIALGVMMKRARFEPPPSLVQLAGIRDFRLILTSTFDPLLADAVAQTRLDLPANRDDWVMSYQPKHDSDIPDPLPATLVFHLLGSLATHPNFAVWEEDYMEFICALLERGPTLKNLFRELGQRHLLLLGAPASDWIVRFFLRVARGSRLSVEPKSEAQAYIADHHESLGEPMVFFFDKMAKATRMVNGDPSAFVAELARRWRDEPGVGLSDEEYLSRMAGYPPKDAVFISYARPNLKEACAIAQILEAAGIPVWLDKTRIDGGENYETKLMQIVKDGCSFFISLISAATEADPNRYMHKERDWAATRHSEGYIFYLPVLLDRALRREQEPACFAKIHHVVFENGALPREFVVRLKQWVWENRTSMRPRG